MGATDACADPEAGLPPSVRVWSLRLNGDWIIEGKGGTYMRVPYGLLGAVVRDKTLSRKLCTAIGDPAQAPTPNCLDAVDVRVHHGLFRAQCTTGACSTHAFATEAVRAAVEAGLCGDALARYVFPHKYAPQQGFGRVRVAHCDSFLSAATTRVDAATRVDESNRDAQTQTDGADNGTLQVLGRDRDRGERRSRSWFQTTLDRTSWEHAMQTSCPTVNSTAPRAPLKNPRSRKRKGVPQW